MSLTAVTKRTVYASVFPSSGSVTTWSIVVLTLMYVGHIFVIVFSDPVQP